MDAGRIASLQPVGQAGDTPDKSGPPDAAAMPDEPRCRPWPPDNKSYVGDFMAALAGTGTLIPFAYLLLAVIFYSVHLNAVWWWQGNNLSAKTQNTLSLLVALAASLAVWLLYALWYRQFTTAARANSAVYEDLRAQYDGLCAHGCSDLLDPPPREGAPAATAAQRAQVRAAYREARTQTDTIAGMLAPISRDLRWTSATGYLAIQQAIHRAQELFILSDPIEAVFAQARSDELRLKDSRIDSSDDLLLTLRWALVGDDTPPSLTSLPRHPLSELQQRMLLMQVRNAIDTFRDQKRGGLIRARNRLLTTVFFTGLLAAMLLSLTMIALPDQPAQRRSIITAGVVFLVGALLGLFNQLYLDSQSDDAVEDYGLATARKVNAPLFSGLAAVGGVLITVLLPGVLATIVPTANGAASTVSLPSRSVPLIEVFDMAAYPFEVVIAMLFGLTPGLLISRLQQQTESYKADLKSTESATQSGSLPKS